jgi:aminoacylase
MGLVITFVHLLRFLDEHPAVSLFRDYLRIKSVQPDPDYAGCVEFLTRQVNRLGLDHHVTELVPGKPIFIMTWWRGY